MLFIEDVKIKEYFNKKQHAVILLLCFGLALAILREVPFLNVIFPENTVIFLIIVITAILFKWYVKPLFLLILIIPTVILFISGSISHAEQLSILIFVILSILVADLAFEF